MQPQGMFYVYRKGDRTQRPQSPAQTYAYAMQTARRLTALYKATYCVRAVK